MVKWKFSGTTYALEISRDARFVIRKNNYSYTDDDKFVLLDRGKPLKKVCKSRRYFARTLFACKILAEDIVAPIIHEEDEDQSS